jgi:hypothetical protein
VTTDKALVIRDRNTHQDTTISDSVDLAAVLTPEGAIYFKDGHVWNFQNGAQTDLGPFFRHAGQPDYLQAKGHYAAWAGGQYTVDLAVYRLDLETGDILAFPVPNDHAIWSLSLASNGDVARAENYSFSKSESHSEDVYLYHEGQKQRIYSAFFIASTVPTLYFLVKTDGSRLIYTAFDGNQGDGLIYTVILHTPTGDSVLASGLTTVSPHEFDLTGGWVGFTRVSNQDNRQAWIQAPEGTQKQITFFNTPSTLAALAPNGELIYSHDGQYFISGFNSASDIPLGFPYDHFYNLSSQWYGTLGGNLFRFDSPVCSPTLKGDVNEDGNLNVTDAVTLLRNIVGLKTLPDSCAEDAADVNGDRSVSVADVTRLLRLLLGLPVGG